MKKILLILGLFAVSFINLCAQSAAVASADAFKEEGIASWYGSEYDGRPTASGEIFDSSQLTCAHPSLPFGTMVTVTNQHNNKSVTVRVNDRGPFVPARIIDVSRAAAVQLDMIITGTAPVKVESIERIVVSQSARQAPVSQAVPVLQTPVPISAIEPAILVRQPTETVPSAAETVPENAPLVIATAVTAQPLRQTSVFCVLTPSIIIAADKTYRLQVGSYKNARNAVNAFDRLKSAGLNPSYERFMPDGNSEFFRVVLAGVRGSDIEITTIKLGEAGFREALIKEE